MKKNTAIKLFDGSVKNLAAALNVTRQAIYQWPDELDQDRIDRVLGAAFRMGKDINDFAPPRDQSA